MEPPSVTETPSRGRTMVLGAVFTLLGLPVVTSVFGAVYFNVVNRNNGVLISSGEEREYLLYVPKSYNAARPTPLVISLHGGGMWPASQREVSQWNRVADEHGFIVVYPAGAGIVRHRAWRAFNAARSEKDVRFISDLIDALKATYNIDSARVYANGLSNGGGMSFVLSCTLSDRIAAIGLVASAQGLSWNWCTDRRAVPMIAFHGTADRQAWYNGGTSWVAGRIHFPGIEGWTEKWARRNQCAPEPMESMVAPDVRRREYTKCADDAPVVLYTIFGGGHTWPGGGPLPEWFVGSTSRSIDASSQMWEFFREHPLRAAQTAAQKD
jgi:polyhydroxybutyrate depolymerase